VAGGAGVPDMAADLTSDDKKKGFNDQKVSIGAANRVEMDGVGA